VICLYRVCRIQMSLPEKKSLEWYRTNKGNSGIGIVSVRDIKDKNRCSVNANIRVCRWPSAIQRRSRKKSAMKRNTYVYEPFRFAVEKLKLRNSNLSFELVRLSAENVLCALLSIEGEPLVDC
jgi:hypothetical protein